MSTGPAQRKKAHKNVPANSLFCKVKAYSIRAKPQIIPAFHGYQLIAVVGKFTKNADILLRNNSEENAGTEPPSNLTGVKTILSVWVQDATYLCLKRRFQHWLKYCLSLECSLWLLSPCVVVCIFLKLILQERRSFVCTLSFLFVRTRSGRVVD